MKFGVIILLFSFAIYQVKHKSGFYSGPKIRVINDTEIYFTNVSLFSMPFENLKPRDTSAYQILNFNALKDDSLIYCSSGDNNFARYLEIPKREAVYVTYVIDSIYNDMLYVSTTYTKEE
ncbi:hypothetical protein [Formosa sp. A9]|uniref:hypothetical protein n=1 Tax=Formosa sp. A9 TaxID=3442641 RepID=UPI003EBE6E46